MISITSCTKNYACTCKAENTDGNSTVTIYTLSAEESSAKSSCNAKQITNPLSENKLNCFLQ